MVYNIKKKNEVNKIFKNEQSSLCEVARRYLCFI